MGRGTRRTRARYELATRTPEQVERERQAKEALRRRRREFLRRLFRRSWRCARTRITDDLW